jgi:hypothetical protein
MFRCMIEFFPVVRQVLVWSRDECLASEGILGFSTSKSLMELGLFEEGLGPFGLRLCFMELLTSKVINL